MGEYIEKQAAIEALGEEPENWIDAEFDLGTQDQWRWDVEAIKAVPPADVRPVVLCKDCDLWNELDSSGRESLGTYRCSCAEWSSEESVFYTGPNEFCSRGERKEEDEE